MAQHRVFCDAVFDKPGRGGGGSQHGDHKETTYTPLASGKLPSTDAAATEVINLTNLKPPGNRSKGHLNSVQVPRVISQHLLAPPPLSWAAFSQWNM